MFKGDNIKKCAPQNAKSFIKIGASIKKLCVNLHNKKLSNSELSSFLKSLNEEVDFFRKSLTFRAHHAL